MSLMQSNCLPFLFMLIEFTLSLALDSEDAVTIAELDELRIKGLYWHIVKMIRIKLARLKGL